MRRISIAAIAGAVLASSASAQKPMISDDIVKIGVLTDLSGQFSHESGEGAVTAVRMAVEDFGGRVLGKTIEVVAADHQNRNEVAIAKAREWYDVGKVDLIANLVNSSIALAVTSIAQEKNRIAIVTTSGSSRLTGDSCTPNSIHYAYDTYALAQGTAKALVKEGLNSWYFLTADYAFGHALESDTSNVLKANGGTVVGAIRYPIDTADHSSFLLQAQASKAKVVAIAGSGTTFINALKSAKDYGLGDGKQSLAGCWYGSTTFTPWVSKARKGWY